MRIVTRPDFDGVVCAVLLYEALGIEHPVLWTEPSDIQQKRTVVRDGDILANLPYHPECSMWFDHHYSNRITVPFEGAFRIAPSAAGVVFDYFKDRLGDKYSELVAAADKIDAARLSVEEVLAPENHPYVILSMTIHNQGNSEEQYWNRMVGLLRTKPIADVMRDHQVEAQCRTVVEDNVKYKTLLKQHTVMDHQVSVTDFRSFDKAPSGNRFLVYSLFPEAVVSMKIRYEDNDKERVIVSAGHSIFNRHCNVNLGLMFSHFEGGGHPGAGACSFHRSKADNYISKISEILRRNENNE